MDDDIARNYARWREAELDERDDDADAAFGAVFETSVPERIVPLQFTASTMAAIESVIEQEARQARRAKVALLWGGLAAALISAWFGGGLVVSAVSGALVASLDLLIGAVVWAATSQDANLWAVLGSIGRASAAFVSDPKVTLAMLAIQGVAIGALVALQRLLGSEREFYE